jgi:predicted kinase
MALNLHELEKNLDDALNNISATELNDWLSNQEKMEHDDDIAKQNNASMVILIGISGSGKSTKAREILRDNMATHVIISRDKIREMMFGYTDKTVAEYYERDDLHIVEQLVSKYEDTLIKKTLANNLIPIMDNTHLQLKYIEKYYHYGVPLTFILIDTPLVECVTRQRNRNRVVNSDIIVRQHFELEKLKSKFNFEPYYPNNWFKPEYSISKKDCYIFDIDGTIALKANRNIFDWSRVGEDNVNDQVVKVMHYLSQHQNISILVCSGRDGSCYQHTVDWLIKHSIPFDGLYMRTAGDNRKDYIIKEEMWKVISNEYNILAMFDDRDQVVNHARKVGFTVFQVADGDF